MRSLVSGAFEEPSRDHANGVHQGMRVGLVALLRGWAVDAHISMSRGCSVMQGRFKMAGAPGTTGGVGTWAALRTLRDWTVRRWVAASIAVLGSLVLLGIPTALIPNPVFARQIEAPGWTWPSLVVTAVLAGLLLATYVRPDGEGASSSDEATPEEARSVTIGGLLSFFAIGCPTCNKLVLIALGSSGAITWFEPVQPVLALAGIVLLAWALRRRLIGESVCEVPAGILLD